MSLQKDDASLRMVFCIQVLVLAQTLGQPILVEQKRDIKMTDQEKQLLSEIKEETLSVIMAGSS